MTKMMYATFEIVEN